MSNDRAAGIADFHFKVEPFQGWYGFLQNVPHVTVNKRPVAEANFGIYRPSGHVVVQSGVHHIDNERFAPDFGIGVGNHPINSKNSSSLKIFIPSSAALAALEPASVPMTT